VNPLRSAASRVAVFATCRARPQMPRRTSGSRSSFFPRPLINLNRTIGALCFVGWLAFASHGLAAFLDQHVEIAQPNNLLAVISSQTVAQTFRAGYSGTLDRIEIQASRGVAPTAPLVVELRTTLADGYPDQTMSGLLANAALPAASVQDDENFGAKWASIDFANDVNLTAGALYAIVLSSQTSTSLQNWYYWAFSHASSDPMPYPQGRAYVQNNSWHVPMEPLGDPGEAFGFRTFMVPEPTALLLAAIAVLATKRRRQRRTLQAATG
jgi:hypothetical protein